jgi:hypothetical protein
MLEGLVSLLVHLIFELDQQVVTKKRLPETLAEFQLAVILVAL